MSIRFQSVSHFVLVSALVLMLLTGLAPVVAQEGEDGPPRVGLRPDAPTYALHGPYWVGVRDYSVPEGETHFWVSIWYPALNPDGAAESTTYNISDERRQALAAALPPNVEAPIAGHALASAAPDLEHGPYPLVLFSPGLNMWRQSQSYEMEHLASQGFVVMAMEHNGETLDSYWGGAHYRPAEMVLAAQYADQLTAVGGDLAGLINPDKLAVIGISSGGWTALVGGGAQLDLSGCSAFLSQAPDADWTADCRAFSLQQDAIASLFGLSSVPAGLWPQHFDPRVDAVVTMDPDGDIWGADYQGVSSVTVPTIVFGSSGDTTRALC